MTISSVRPPEKTGPPWTILRLVNWTASYFASHEIEQPRATAEVLLAHILGLNRIDLYLRHDQPLERDELAQFKSCIKRRVDREPVAYITGEREFWSLTLAVTPDVLIPRPETECLVEAALRLMPDDNAESPACRVLDMGTGSGAIALAVASERPSATVFALDRSPAAIRIARSNARRHALDERVHFFCSNWFSSIGADRRFDVILSNPPYIRREDMADLQPEIVRYEPHGALDGGIRGLDDVAMILRTANGFLRPGGHVLLEIGHDQKSAVQAVARETGDYEPAVFFKDYSGHDRVLQLRLASQ